MDSIQIKDLALRAIIGVYPEERKEKQDVVLNILLYTNLFKAGKSDDLADTVDYKSLKKEIVGFVEVSSYNLIEALAHNVARLCLKDKRIIQAKVTIDKPGALRFAKSVSVTVERKQQRR